MTTGNIKLGCLAISILTALGLSACGGFYDEVSVTQRGTHLDVNGVIDAGTFSTIQEAVRRSSDITTLRLVKVPGSVDDQASLTALAGLVKKHDLAIVVPANGMVASGGTDMALMSKKRVIENGACIGVHSWAIGNLFGFDAGSDRPRSDEIHDLYLDFYKTVDVPEDFYWFTLEAASPDDIHWMTPAEINRFGLSTTRLDESTSEIPQARAERCNARWV